MVVFRSITGYDIPKVNFYLTLNAASTATTLDEVKGLNLGYIERVYGPKAVSLDKGWQQERTESAGPIYLSGALNQTQNHIERMADYIGFEKWLHTANNYITNEKIQQAIVSRLGKNDLDFLNKNIYDVVDMKFQREQIETITDFLAKNTTLGMLWMMPATMAKQMVSYVSSAEVLGMDAYNPSMFTQAMKNVAFNYDVTRSMWQNLSGYVWARANQGYSRDAQDIRRNNMLIRTLTGKREGVFNAFRRGLISDYAGPKTQRLRRILSGSKNSVSSLQEMGMAGIQKMDEATILLVAEMARMKYMKDHNLDENMSPKQIQLMTEYAEDVIRKTQSASSLVDRAQMLRSRNRMIKLFTQFTSSVTKDIGAVYRTITDERQPIMYRLSLAGMIFGSQVLLLAGIDELGDQLFGKPDDEKGMLGVRKEDEIPERIAKRMSMNAIYNLAGAIYLSNIMTRGFAGWLQYGRQFPLVLPAMYAGEKGGQAAINILSGATKALGGEDGSADLAKGTVRAIDAASLGLLGIPGIRVTDKLLALIANLQGEEPKKLEQLVSE
jgi:hypothetical protein